MMQLELSQIRLDGGTQPRASYHFGIAEAYAEDMAAGAMFPPVIVFYDGADYWLADGFHRVFAAEKIEQTAIEADVRQGTQQDAQWYSYSVNQTHGLRRTNDDKRRVVEAALRHPFANEKSDYEIADHCGVSHQTVANYRNALSKFDSEPRSPTRTGRDGRKTNTAKIGKKKRQPAAQPSQNGHSAAPTPAATPDPVEPQADPDELFEATLKAFSDGLQRLIRDTLPNGLDPDAFRRIMDIVAQSIAVDV